MTRRSPTIVDVAKAAGVSIGAVSKAMRNSYGVSPQMREAVSRAIEELGYRPRVGARSMRGSTFTLGFVVPGAFSPFFSDIYAGMDDGLAGTPFRAIVALASEDDDPSDSPAIHDLLDRQVDGIVLVAPTVSRSWIEDVARRVPVVVVARHDVSDLYDSVYGDDEAGAAAVMRHLFDQGHHDIVHIANHDSGYATPETPHGDRIRRETYERMMHDAGLADRIHVVESRFDEHAAYLSTRQLFGSGRIPTAIFAGADEAAFGAMRAIAELPEDAADRIAIAGYDNTRFADHPSMALTSVDQAGRELGRRAAGLLLGRLKSERPSRQESLQPRLIVRRSSTDRAVRAGSGDDS